MRIIYFSADLHKNANFVAQMFDFSLSGEQSTCDMWNANWTTKSERL